MDYVILSIVLVSMVNGISDGAKETPVSTDKLDPSIVLLKQNGIYKCGAAWIREPEEYTMMALTSVSCKNQVDHDKYARIVAYSSGAILETMTVGGTRIIVIHAKDDLEEKRNTAVRITTGDGIVTDDNGFYDGFAVMAFYMAWHPTRHMITKSLPSVNTISPKTFLDSAFDSIFKLNKFIGKKGTCLAVRENETGGQSLHKVQVTVLDPKSCTGTSKTNVFLCAKVDQNEGRMKILPGTPLIIDDVLYGVATGLILKDKESGIHVFMAIPRNGKIEPEMAKAIKEAETGKVRLNMQLKRAYNGQ